MILRFNKYLILVAIGMQFDYEDGKEHLVFYQSKGETLWFVEIDQKVDIKPVEIGKSFRVLQRSVRWLIFL